MLTLLAHNYDGVVFTEVAEALAERYLPAMEQLHRFLAGRDQEHPAACVESKH